MVCVKCGSNQYCDPSSHNCHSCNDICNPDHANRDLCSNLCQGFLPPLVKDTNRTLTETKHDEQFQYYPIVVLAIIFVVFVYITCKYRKSFKHLKCIKTYPRHKTDKQSDVEWTRGTSVTNGEDRNLVDVVDAGMKKIDDSMDIDPFWADKEASVSSSDNIISHAFGIKQHHKSSNQNAPETDCRDVKTRKSVNQQSTGEETIPKSSLHEGVLAEGRFSAAIEDSFQPESLAFGDLLQISPSQSLHPSSPGDTSHNCDLKSDPVTVHSNRFGQVLKAYDAVNMRGHELSYIRGCAVDNDKFHVVISNSCSMSRAQNEIRNILPLELQSDVVAIQYIQECDKNN